jgi:hypothetical protein
LNIARLLPNHDAAGSQISLSLFGEADAEGEELQTDLLQAKQRIPANSSVPDEVFGIHTGLAGEEVQMAPSSARFPCGQGTLQNRGRRHARDPK